MKQTNARFIFNSIFVDYKNQNSIFITKFGFLILFLLYKTEQYLQKKEQ